MSKYGVNHRIQSEHRKIRTKKNSIFGHFPRSATFLVDTGRKLNVLCTFNLRLVSTGLRKPGSTILQCLKTNYEEVCSGAFRTGILKVRLLFSKRFTKNPIKDYASTLISGWKSIIAIHSSHLWWKSLVTEIMFKKYLKNF